MSQETTNVVENTEATQQELTPVFEEANNIDETSAMNVLIQAANLAQASGKLTVRDSVLLAKAIDTVRPGTI
jgi:thioester reductase-like protein